MHVTQAERTEETPVKTPVEVVPSEADILRLKALLRTKLKAIEESESLEALEALIAFGEATAAAKEGITIDVTVTEPAPTVKKRRKAKANRRQEVFAL